MDAYYLHTPCLTEEAATKRMIAAAAIADWYYAAWGKVTVSPHASEEENAQYDEKCRWYEDIWDGYHYNVNGAYQRLEKHLEVEEHSFYPLRQAALATAEHLPPVEKLAIAYIDAAYQLEDAIARTTPDATAAAEARYKSCYETIGQEFRLAFANAFPEQAQGACARIKRSATPTTAAMSSYLQQVAETYALPPQDWEKMLAAQQKRF